MEQMEQLATGYTLIEGPVWDPDRGLLFSDVHDGGVYCISPDGAVSTAVEHRRGIGGMALHEAGGLVVGGRNVAYKGPARESTTVLLERETVADIIGFNDLTTDSAGRIYAGSLGGSPFAAGGISGTGFLHMIDVDGTSRVLSDGVKLTNGLGFSPDGATLYHCDSRSDTIRAYSVNNDGTVGAWRTFAQVGKGVPDGLAVAEDGSIWVAIARGDCVRVWDADGTEREPIACPLHMPTSVCFGGADLRDLYIVTGSEGTDSDHGGTVFRMRVDVPGLPLTPARVRLN
ncbi:MAG: SMP-30/gluconolactonase/LRE family protein [Gammaproteobacteria bacterium]|nr:SMP-30/gluconolactonase/LRE family protein [Gammaproteobacteria bacterium]